MNTRRDTTPRLGRGLAALLGDVAVQAPPQGAAIRQVPLDLLEPNPFQPRSSIDPAALEELAQSIRLRGILQPLLVRPHPDNRRPLPDRRRRAPLAGRRCRGTARGPRAGPRDDRHRGRRRRLGGEPAASGPECDGRGRGLQSPAHPVRVHAGGAWPGRGQVSQPHRQHAAAAEPAGRGEGCAAQGRDHGRPCACPADASRAGDRTARRDRPAIVGPPDRGAGGARPARRTHAGR